ncbi:unnamed protein product [Spirodela intermedia]|uniref:Uncharacterized protein n=1 Tax=Spirodela intermedia TaxID=51605 RepID=A0A7I8J3Y0_SPIIN|nr:unnamed protein product [Spirodela intermedia]CAA6664091.1 unnamed protein product [Spirodela intermedia]
MLKSASRSLKNTAEVGIFHLRAAKLGLSMDVQVGTHLMSSYSKCGCLESACKLFGEMPHRNTVSWTVLITGFSGIRQFSQALGIFSQMLNDGALPNCVTLASAFRCCAGSRDVTRGKGLHGWILRNGLGSDAILGNSMVDFYAKCGDFHHAATVFDSMPERDRASWNIMIGAHLQNGNVEGSVELFKKLSFRDVVSWNTLINGQIQNGCHKMALEFLYQMAEAGPAFSHFTFSMALSLVGTLSMPELGRQIHGKLLRSQAGLDGFIRSSLVDMYGKCGNMESASTVFSDIRDPLNTVSWSSMVAGYVHNQRHGEALSFLQRMLDEHVEVDLYTLTSIATACSHLGILAQGRQIHAFAEKLGHASDIYLSAAITDMYGKCGSLEDARAVFEKANKGNLVLWTSMIASYASHGRGREAIQAFKLLLENKISPNEVTFVSVLCACSHAGLVREGYEYLRMMREDFGLVPGVEHLTCVVDLLGRAGLVEEARNFIYENNISKVSASWKALLSACRLQGNVDMARFASEQLVKLEPFDAGSYLLLSNIYSTTRQWADASRIRRKMEENGVRSHPGMSWIQLKNSVHMFIAGDRSHPQTEEIHSCLSKLIPRLKGTDFHNELNLVLQGVGEEQSKRSY